MKNKIAVIGTVGVPANYGGFETLAERLVNYHDQHLTDQIDLLVYCSDKAYTHKPTTYKSANLKYLPLSANGSSSVPYDIWSILHAVIKGHDTLLLLGVSGAMVLPLVRLISRVKIVTNVDGIEWKRDKWNGIAKAFLRFSEYVAVKFSHTIISDNQAIANHVQNSYQTFSEVIAYGGDHAIAPSDVTIDHLKLPKEYALSLCRIEPENNVEMILSAFAKEHDHNLVFVGNWDGSEYGRSLKARYAIHKNITIVDPIYDLGVLYQIRNNSSLYFHGHSAGGTNPSLVEMMHFKKPIFCFDCDFNRYSTDDRAMYFSNSDDIVKGLQNKADNLHEVAESMQRLAHERYTWDIIGKRYFDLM